MSKPIYPILLAALISLFGCRQNKPLTAAELYGKYANSVVLIKHAFLYKIHIGNTNYYFKSYDPNTGRVDGLTDNFDSIKQSPNVIWGTGFFIDSAGTVLTCRHIVNVMPPAIDQQKIQNAFKDYASGRLIKFYQLRDKAMQQIESLNNLLQNYSYAMSTYEYAEKTQERNNDISLLYGINNEISVWQNITNMVFDESNAVSETELQLGIFPNSSAAQNLIPCGVVKVSSDQNIDLATIQISNSSDIPKQAIPVNLSRIMQTGKEPLTLAENISMIGYNYGIDIAATTSGIKSQITEGAISQCSDNNKILYTIPALPGSSGSPVFDGRGRVVSVNYAGVVNSQSFNYGINPNRIKEFLNDHSVTETASNADNNPEQATNTNNNSASTIPPKTDSTLPRDANNSNPQPQNTADDNNNAGSNVATTDVYNMTAQQTVETFFNSISNKDYQTAWQLTDNPKWNLQGGSQWFHDEVFPSPIQFIGDKFLYEISGEAGIAVEYYTIDTAGNQKYYHHQKVILQKEHSSNDNSNRWKIVRILNL